jgi:hypothetical protein
MGRKSKTMFVIPSEAWDAHDVARSYYCFCLESAIANVRQARALSEGGTTEENHDLSKIEQLLVEALEAS